MRDPDRKTAAPDTGRRSFSGAQPRANSRNQGIKMTFKTLLLAGAATAMMTTGASAIDLTIVSWGGAYSNS
jgi:hypothetical protein